MHQRDAAYDTLIRSQRQHIHARIATILEREFPELLKTQPEMAAHHCAEGGLPEQAIEYYLAVAQRATAGSNNTEARRHVTKSLAQLEGISASPRRGELLRRIQQAGWWGPT
jgi:predicted ATPase